MKAKIGKITYTFENLDVENYNVYNNFSEKLLYTFFV